MPRNKKRKHDESDAVTVVGASSHKDHKRSKREKREKQSKTSTPPVSTTLSTSSSETDSVSQNFDVFKRALTNLLSIASSTAESKINESLGDEKASFIIALQSMKSSGDLSWLDTNVPPPSSSSSPPRNHNLPTPSTTPREPPLPQAPTLSIGRPATLPTIITSSEWPPPLPTLKNELLRQQTFTHKSFIKGEEVSLPGTEQRHYERLEFLGDSYLQSIASHILFTRFPTLREGALSDMRQQLVANKPLSTYATMYQFHTLIREGKGQENLMHLPGKPHYKEGHRPPPGKPDLNKTLADCFEAYIAAIILDDPVCGVKTATEWLEKLYEPKLREMEMQHREVAPIDKMAKQTLNTIAGGSKVCIEYKWTDGKGGNKGGFWITVLLTGWGWKEREIGRGWGTNKSDAALRAAMNVIANKDFVEEMAATRLKWLGPKPTSTGTPALTPTPTATTSSTSSPRPVAQSGGVLNYDD